jgi:hypothetical protein
MSALMQLSEGKTLERWQVEAAAKGADAFFRRTNLGYVVWRNNAITPELRAFAMTVFGLTKVMEADGYELYVPRRTN